MTHRFGVQLLKWREAKGLSQAQLAAKIGKSPPWVTQTEKGKEAHGRGLGAPDHATCVAIADALGVPASAVWGAAVQDRTPPEERAWWEARTKLLNDQLTDAERGLIESLRRLEAPADVSSRRSSGRRGAARQEDAEIPDGVHAFLGARHSIASGLADLLLALQVDRSVRTDGDTRLDDFVEALVYLPSLPITAQIYVLRALRSAVLVGLASRAAPVQVA